MRQHGGNPAVDKPVPKPVRGDHHTRVPGQAERHRVGVVEPPRPRDAGCVADARLGVADGGDGGGAEEPVGQRDRLSELNGTLCFGPTPVG